MKTAPYATVVFTAVLALAAGVVLASEERDLFDPQQAMLETLIADTDMATPSMTVPVEDTSLTY